VNAPRLNPKKRVQVEHVALQPVAEGPAERRRQLKRRRAHAVVVTRDLIRIVFAPLPPVQVERLVQPPDIAFERIAGTVSGSVRK
jgi:hypothetical protein